MTHAEQQAELDKVAAEINANHDLWHQDDAGGVDTSGISPERQKQMGIYRERKPDTDGFPDLIYRPISWRPADIEMDEGIKDELARQDPKFKKQLDESRMETVTIAFTSGNPDYLSTERNFGKIIKVLETELELPSKFFDQDEIIEKSYAAGLWTVEHLTGIFRSLKKSGKLDVVPGEPKNLTQGELLSVLSDIRLGNSEGALTRYLGYAMTDANLQNADPRTFMTRHPELVAKAVWYVWGHLHPELSQTELSDFKKSMARHALPTVHMLETSWFLRKESNYLNPNRPTPSAEPQPVVEETREMTQKELEALSDEEIEELRIKAMHEYRRKQYL